MNAAVALPHRRAGDRFATWLLIALCFAGLARTAAGASIPVKALVAQALLARAFDRGLETHRAQKPWPWADMAPIARLAVPRLGVDRIVLDGGSGQAMAFGPTLLPGGARIGGAGTIVLAAHRDTHFRFLQDIRTGDLITLRGTAGTLATYRVTGAGVVRWDAFAIRADRGARGLDLATCYPFHALRHGPLRYVVHAVEIGSPAERARATSVA